MLRLQLTSQFKRDKKLCKKHTPLEMQEGKVLYFGGLLLILLQNRRNRH